MVGNGMSYSRYNISLKRKEYIAFGGYSGAWTDNPSYFERIRM
jgi:hypothetical protein